MKYRYQRFTLSVGGANSTYKDKFTLDKDVAFVRAIQVTADLPDQLFYRGSQRIEISGVEIFPEDYESRLLMSGIGVMPDDRYVKLNEHEGIPAGNGEVKVAFKDSNNASLDFAAYTVSFLLLCELK